MKLWTTTVASLASVGILALPAFAAGKSNEFGIVHEDTITMTKSNGGVILAQTTTPSPAATPQIPTQSGQSGAVGSSMPPNMPEMAGRMHGMGMNMQEMGRRMEQQGQKMQQSGATMPPNADPTKMGMGMDKMEMGMKDMGGAMGPHGM